MIGFTVTGHAQAPVEEVWKLLFDPVRFPEWWVGVETVRTDQPGEYTLWPVGYPDFPMPQQLRTDTSAGRVTMSCQVSDIDFGWRLADTGGGTAIEVRVDLPAAQRHRLDGQREVITESMARLVALAESTG